MLVYYLHKHKIARAQFNYFFISLGNTFIGGGDYNAKHILFGSRQMTSKGRKLYQCTFKSKFTVGPGMEIKYQTYLISSLAKVLWQIIYEC